MDEHSRSIVFSILKCGYGWNGMAKSYEQQNELDAIVERHECVMCAAKEMAAFLFDNYKPECFRPRIDGKPNTYSVVRDRQGGHNTHLH